MAVAVPRAVARGASAIMHCVVAVRRDPPAEAAGGPSREEIAMPRTAPTVVGPWSRLLGVVMCPVCRGCLGPDGGSLRCANGHSFDVARQGYVSLLTGGMRAFSADTAPMVQARVTFLAAGHYAPLARLLAETAAALCPAPGVVVDAGAGTGYYLAGVLDQLPDAVGLGLDASKFALRRAGRVHPRLGAAVCDIWQALPVQSGSVDVLVNVFAPRNAPEFHRVLHSGGAFVVVTPTQRHLVELRQRLRLLSVDAAKEQRLRHALAGLFREEGSQQLEYEMELTAQDAGNLVAMGPNAHHFEALPGGVARSGSLLRVTASFQVSVFRPRI